jgi:hypothetical protein
MRNKEVSNTQALRSVYNGGVYVIVKAIPSKRERKKQSQNGLEDKGEVLPNHILSLNATIAITLRLYK